MGQGTCMNQGRGWPKLNTIEWEEGISKRASSHVLVAREVCFGAHTYYLCFRSRGHRVKGDKCSQTPQGLAARSNRSRRRPGPHGLDCTRLHDNATMKNLVTVDGWVVSTGWSIEDGSPVVSRWSHRHDRGANQYPAAP
jgi:hypothetical protein